MNYQVARVCSNFELLLKDTLKRTSELISSLTNVLVTNVNVSVDVENRIAILFLDKNEKQIPLISFHDGTDIKMSLIESVDKQVYDIRKLLNAVSQFITLLNRKLNALSKQNRNIYNQEQWNEIHKMSNNNGVIFDENSLELTKDIINHSHLLVSVSEETLNSILDICEINYKDNSKSFVVEPTDDFDKIINQIKISINPTNKGVKKGFFDKNRVMIKNDSPFKIRQFDETKDFTVRDTIKALMNFDLDLPVTIISSAPGIGHYDNHIWKIDKTFLSGFNKTEAVGFFMDETFIK